MGLLGNGRGVVLRGPKKELPGTGRRSVTTLRLLSILFGILAWADEGRPQETSSSPERVTYDLEVRFFPDRHSVEGKATITWRSPAEEPVSELWFHLYLNGFKNERTTLMRETSPEARGAFRRGEWGSIDILTLRQFLGVAGGLGGEEPRESADLLPGLVFVQPDDGNPWDQTVARVELARPVLPGESVTVVVQFVSRFPHAFSRTGYHRDYLMAAQWFPKLGVYRTAPEVASASPPWNRAGWYCPQYHAHCEFFSDFGRYRVAITAPSEYRIGATGVCVEGPTPRGDGTSNWIFEQDRVHDFAWAADPRFLVEERVFDPGDPTSAGAILTEADLKNYRREKEWVESALDLNESELACSPVEVRLFLQPDHLHQRDRYLRAVMNGLLYYGLWFGAYPYETLTVIDPAYGAQATGGMEYPTLITTGTRFLRHSRSPSPVGVTLHELAHQYWYGLVANDEFEEAWLDEGLTVYTTNRVLEVAYGDRIRTSSFSGFEVGRVPILPLSPQAGEAEPVRSLRGALPGLELQRFAPPENGLLAYFRELPFLTYLEAVPDDPWEARRDLFVTSDSGFPIRTRSYDFSSAQDYRRAVYIKAPLALSTLEHLLGKETFLKVLREFQGRHRFGHPSGEDFLRVVNEVSGTDHRGLFEVLMDTTATIDFEVKRVISQEIGVKEGIFDEGEERVVIGPKNWAEARGESRSEDRGGPKQTEGEGSGRYENEFVVVRHGEVSLPVVVEYKIEGREERQRLEWDGRDSVLVHRFEDSGPLEWVRVDPEGEILLDEVPSNNVRLREPDHGASREAGIKVLRWVLSVLHYYGSFG